jgi:hypothetical protein
MRWRHPVQAAIVGSASASGLIAAHVVAYALAVPDAADRAHVLRETGHGYLPAAEVSVLPLVLVAFFLAAASTIAGRPGRDGNALQWRPLTMRLAVAQCLGYFLLETSERLFTQGSLHGLLGPVLAIGLAVQVVAAAATAWLLASVGRSVEQALEASPGAVRPSFGFAVPAVGAAAGHGPTVRVVLTGAGRRAPPSDRST